MTRKAHFLLCLSLLFCVGVLKAQTASQSRNLQEVINCAEAYMGSSDLLVNGRPYFSLHSLAKGFPYFDTPDWTPGVIFVKEHVFEVSDLKFNIETDRLILKTQFKNGSNTLTELTPALVDSFRIGERTFVNLANLPNGKPEFGFAEKIYSGGIHFYLKHQKSFIATFNNVTPHGSYSVSGLSYFIYSQKTFSRLSGKNEFMNFFGQYKKQVSKFMKQEGIQFNKASKEQLYTLLTYCDGLY